MAYDEALRTITLNADATLAVFTGAPGLPGSANGVNVAGNQYRAVIVTGARQAGLSNANATTGKVVGILQNKPQAAGKGNAATIGFSGISKVKVSTNINAGQTVFANTDGTGANVGANVGGVNIAIGIALDTSTVNGSLVPVLLQLGE